MSDLIEFSPFVLRGVYVTIGLSVCSAVVAVAFGLLGAWAKLSKSRRAQRLANLYTTLIRGVPDLVLMLLVYYGGQIIFNRIGEALGLWDYIEIHAFTAGFLSIGFIFGAYLTETFRGAYMAIPGGQIEAGVAAGLSRGRIFLRIVWPQLVRLALPSFTNNWLTLMKTTALVSVIGLEDVVYNGFSAGRSTQQPFMFMFAVLIIYLILTAASELGLRRLDRKYSKGLAGA